MYGNQKSTYILRKQPILNKILIRSINSLGFIRSLLVGVAISHGKEVDSIAQITEKYIDTSHIHKLRLSAVALLLLISIQKTLHSLIDHIEKTSNSIFRYLEKINTK